MINYSNEFLKKILSNFYVYNLINFNYYFFRHLISLSNKKFICMKKIKRNAMNMKSDINHQTKMSTRKLAKKNTNFRNESFTEKINSFAQFSVWNKFYFLHFQLLSWISKFYGDWLYARAMVDVSFDVKVVMKTILINQVMSFWKQRWIS